MREEIICAGFGGQGIMLLGRVIAQTALKEGRQVTLIPSYGAAMRGGCAFCMVVIADREIASPYVDKCDSLFVFNQPSWDSFKGRIKKGGLILFNSTLIEDRQPSGGSLKIRKLPFTTIASSLGDVRVANMVALGVYLKEKDILRRKTVSDVLAELTSKDKLHMLEINRRALEKGYEAV